MTVKVLYGVARGKTIPLALPLVMHKPEGGNFR